MSSFRTIHYQDMLEVIDKSSDHTESRDEFASLNYNDPFWGSISERKLVKQEYTISHFRTDLNGDYAISFNDDRLENSVNICINQEGYTGVHFRKKQFEAALTAKKQHSVYIAENEYNVLVKKSMDNVHFAIDRDYYVSLLGESEEWSRQLRKQLSQRELVYQGEYDVTPAMQRLVADILYNPLSGSLRELMVEAKVLELIALQLESTLDRKDRKMKTCHRDRDLFFAVRDHLNKTFMEDHSLKALGKTFGVNDCKLKSGFKNTFSKTIFEYIHDLRMEHAYQLLHINGLQVNEVSGKVGYKNPNHFSTAFKKKFGVNPGKI